MPVSPRTSPTQPSVSSTRLGVRAWVHRFKSCFKLLLLTALLTANVASGAVAAGTSAVTSGLSANVNATVLVTDYKAAKALAEFDALTTAETKVAKVDDVTLACPEGCFVAGTKVLTNEGLKPIDTFVGGELVWSHNEETGEGNFKRVQSTKATAHQLIYRITLSNSSRQSEVIESTSEHPFWVERRVGWCISNPPIDTN